MTPRSIIPVADRLALIILRLASDHDGEVVASARAIGRVLHSAGLDFYDLTAAVSSRAREKPFERAGQDTAPLWGELTLSGRCAWLYLVTQKSWLSAWEEVFVADIATQNRALPGRHFSAKQQIVLNRIIARAFSMGIRP